VGKIQLVEQQVLWEEEIRTSLKQIGALLAEGLVTKPKGFIARSQVVLQILPGAIEALSVVVIIIKHWASIAPSVVAVVTKLVATIAPSAAVLTIKQVAITVR